MTTIQVNSIFVCLEALEWDLESDLEMFKANFPGELSTYLRASIKAAFLVEALRTNPTTQSYARVKSLQLALMNGDIEKVKSIVEPK